MFFYLIKAYIYDETNTLEDIQTCTVFLHLPLTKTKSIKKKTIQK